MNVTDLRKIGKRLKKEIPSLVLSLHEKGPVRKGASGDMTYPIDKKAEEIVIEEIERLGMPVTVVSEECGFKDIKGGGIKILIDPIDGSKNALGGITFFSTSIAVIEGDIIGALMMGYILNLATGDEFWAIKDKGSFLNAEPIRTQQNHAFNVIAYETSSPKVDIPKIMPLLSLFNRTRCLGSTALDMAFLSRGAISMFVTPTPSRTFDFAAGYLLIKEAGGVVTDLKGNGIEDIKIGVQRATPILASANEELHKRALEVLKQN